MNHLQEMERTNVTGFGSAPVTGKHMTSTPKPSDSYPSNESAEDNNNKASVASDLPSLVENTFQGDATSSCETTVDNSAILRDRNVFKDDFNSLNKR